MGTRYWLLTLALLLGGSWPTASALADCDLKADDCVAIGEWRVSVGLGLGVRTNPLVEEKDNPLVLLPEISYFGERFFLNNLELGFTLAEDARQQVNLVVMPGYDQMFFNRWDPFNFTAEAGVGSGLGSLHASSGFAVQVHYAQSSAPLGPRPPSGRPTGGASEAPEDSVELPGEYFPEPAPQAVQINDARGLLINGVRVATDATGSVGGYSDNRINVVVHGSGDIEISGLVEGDRVEVQGGDGMAYAVGVRDHTLAVDERQLPAAAEVLDTQHWVEHLDKRRITALGGVEYSWFSAYASLHLQLLSDLLDTHGGQELRVAATFPLERNNDRFAATLGANWQSREVLDYYYGLHSAEAARLGISTYRPQSSAITPLLRLDWQRALSEHWSLRAMWQFMPLSDETRNSPFVDGDSVQTVFFGGVYHF